MVATQQEQPAATTVDPITFAVVRNALIAAARQGATVLKRTAMFPLIYEALDFAVSLYDSRLNVVAEAPGLPLFSGALGPVLPTLITDEVREGLKPGDVLITNHPFLNGSHTPDIVVVEPVFHDDRPVAFVAARAHVGDTGGNGFSAASADVFQEGLLLPPMKLCERGELNETIVKILRANTRTPELTVGDLFATATGVRAGCVAVQAVLDRYGIDVYNSVIDGILDHGERMARKGLRRLPDGVYRAQGALDDNGVQRRLPVELKVSVTVSDGQLTVDTTGSAPQQVAAVNCPLTYTLAASRMILKTLATPDIPSNSGEHRALRLVAPEGSIFNPLATAPAALSMLAATQLTELILEALAPALPDEIPAGGGGDVVGFIALLSNPETGRICTPAFTSATGLGAIRGADGPSAVFARQASGLRVEPLEVLEARYPVVRRRFELDPDSGGAGRWRGGLGVIEEEEYYAHGIGMMMASRTSGAWPIRGLQGGLAPKRLNGVRVHPGTEAELGPPSCLNAQIPLAPGDRYVSWTAGGGGFGDPMRRNPQAVLEDVRNGYVSVEAARELYGVVISGEGANQTATRLAVSI
jgi:N-methylhydantoinase B